MAAIAQQYALEFERIGGRLACKMQSAVPADETPADELDAFFKVMDTIGAPYKPTAVPGKYSFCLGDEKVWTVKVVAVGDMADTQQMEAAS